MNPQDNPHFTAYALGELDATQAREIHAMLRENSASAHELEQIEAVTDALRHGAPIPNARLSPDQRHAVLHPSNLPRFVQPMMPRPAPVKKPAVIWNRVGRVLKAAAVITLTGGAFLLGWQMHQPVETTLATNITPPASEPVKPQTKPVEVVEAPKAPAPKVEVIVAKAPEAAPKVEKAPVVVAETPKPAPVVVTTVVEAPKPAAPAPQPSLSLGFTMPRSLPAFASTSKEPGSRYTLHPALVRPAPVKNAGEAFASPAKGKADEKHLKASELLIHSWQAEVATCPWNASHRLLRLVIQLPANQTAVISSSETAFPMQVSFDPLSVKQFRLLGERHIPAAHLDQAGTHVVWYEFEPNGKSDLKTPATRQIATLTVPNTRFTQKAVGPFDDSKLQVLDRGFTLDNARDDFLFESAVVGFGMLMRGMGQIGSLDHELVLNLASRSKTESPERSRFIKLVQDVQKAAGL
ncbi:MAG: DUF3520 domain-containing protein [Verrucomicrobiaceae bacterium]|nr:DUF3520 domain-containing protein [Verrucomicrobiaceae bacterium]